MFPFFILLMCLLMMCLLGIRLSVGFYHKANFRVGTNTFYFLRQMSAAFYVDKAAL